MRSFSSIRIAFSLILALLLSVPLLAGELPQTPKVVDDRLNFGQNPQFGGTFVVSTTTGPEGFNPVIATSTSTIAITDLIFGRLFEVHPITLEQEPELAKSWKASEGGKVYTFYLREGLKWSDGQPLTAEDVVFTFKDLHFNPDVESDTRSQLQLKVDGEKKLPQVKKVDKYTVQFTFPKVFAPALEGLTTPILPKHVLKDQVHKLNPEVSQGNFNETWSLDTNVDEIVGCGPFTIKEFASGRYIILEKNPYSFFANEQGEQLPYLDKIKVLFVENEQASVTKFLNGGIDALSISAKNYPTLKKREPKENFRVYRAGPGFGTSHNFGFNQDVKDEDLKKLFRNVKFRRAVAYAFDEGTVVENVFNDLAQPQWGPISAANTLYHNPNLKKYSFDLDRARELLDEIGLTDEDGDGIRETSEGEDLAFTAITNAGSDRIDMANIFANDLEKIGIKMTVKGLEFNTVINRMLEGEFEVAVMSLVGSRDPHGTGTNVFGSDGGFHYWHWSAKDNPNEAEKKIDELLSKAASTVELEERQKYYDEYQRILSEQVPLLFTVQPEVLYAVWNYVGNVGETPSPYLLERRGSLFLPLAHLIYLKK